MVAYLALAAAVVLWLRSRSIVLPIALLAALVATESLVTILEIALDRPQPTGRLGGWRAAVGRCFSFWSQLTPSPGQLPDATADRRSTMSRLYNDPARFAEDAAEGLVSTVLDEAIAIQRRPVAP